jgi:hypothetical protein
VEGSGSYGAGLTRHLQAVGLAVVEDNRPHVHMRACRGKNDAIDGEAAARKVLAGECTTVPKNTTRIVEATRQLHLARASAVQACATAIRSSASWSASPAPVRAALNSITLAGKARQALRWPARSRPPRPCTSRGPPQASADAPPGSATRRPNEPAPTKRPPT